MACEKHQQRKRKDCIDCFPDTGEISNDNTTAELPTRKVLDPASEGTIPKAVAKAACIKVKLSEQTKELQGIITGPALDMPGSPRMEEGKYIRVLIEAEIQKALIKVRSELAELRNIKWEHLHIPDPVFCMDLMLALEKDGWKYCDHIKNPKLYGYSSDVDFYLMSRIARDDNAPMPDFSKSGNAKRYMDKKNGKEST
jgi:hypothetical protein